MATIIRRPGKNGQLSYRAQVRRKGAPPLSATFTKLSDARKWIQVTEAAILEGRHIKTAEAQRHTLGDLTDRYVEHILPQTGSTIRLCGKSGSPKSREDVCAFSATLNGRDYSKPVKKAEIPTCT
jgi:hypothetical protein